MSITLGSITTLYTDAQLPFTMDGSFATVKISGSEAYFWHTLGPDNYKYRGTLAAPLTTRQWHKTTAQMWNMQGDTSTPWLYNIYVIDATHYLGFLHMEHGEHEFTIGLGYSSDAGDTWTFCGDILRPYVNAAEDNPGGCPYVVVGSYFYLYYADYTTSSGGSKRICVARAPIADVVTAAASNTVTAWTKYNAGAWDQNGLTGLGSSLFPGTFAGNLYGCLDPHSDAAYCSGLGKYVLTLSTMGFGILYMAQSSDGVTWPQADLVRIDDLYDGSTNQRWQHYSTIIDLSSSASTDSRTVGGTFTVIWPRKGLPASNDDDVLYSRTVSTGSAPEGTPILSVA